jgi:hypothetical protein
MSPNDFIYETLTLKFINNGDKSFVNAIRREMTDQGFGSLSNNINRRLLFSTFAILLIEDDCLLIDCLSYLKMESHLATKFDFQFNTCSINVFDKKIYSDDVDCKYKLEPKAKGFSDIAIDDNDLSEAELAITRIMHEFNKTPSDVNIDGGELSEKKEIDLLCLIYFRKKLNPSLRSGSDFIFKLINKMTDIHECIWESVFSIGIFEEDITFLNDLYKSNEYYLMYNGEAFLKKTISLNLLESMKWLYKKGLKIKIEENVFDMLESSTTREMAFSIIFSRTASSLLHDVRDLDDAKLLVRIKECNPLDLLSQTEDNEKINILMSI